MEDLTNFVDFHDRHIDLLAVREGNRLTLGLKFDERPAAAFPHAGRRIECYDFCSKTPTLLLAFR